MKKSDLKTGMIVQSKGGNIGIVLNTIGILYQNEGYNEFNDFDEDLTNKIHPNGDLVIISSPIDIQNSPVCRWDEWIKENTIWTREEKKLPESWYELPEITGFYVKVNSFIVDLQVCVKPDLFSRNVFATNPQAEASRALAQITQLVKDYNGDWVPDWSNEEEYKYTIEYVTFFKLGLIPLSAMINPCLLAFETEEQRDHFLKHHVDLIKQAAPLLWGLVID